MITWNTLNWLDLLISHEFGTKHASWRERERERDFIRGRNTIVINQSIKYIYIYIYINKVKTSRGRGWSSAMCCSLEKRTEFKRNEIFLSHIKGKTNLIRDFLFLWFNVSTFKTFPIKR